MDIPLITGQGDLEAYCRGLDGVRLLGLDTEFVSEHTFRPQLCLVQVAADEELTLIDPLAVDDMEPFWQAIAGGAHRTLVHGGREEFLFCLRATGRRPSRLFDLQVAAGLIGMGYPVGYDSLVGRLTGRRPASGESRTDWRRRPLRREQLSYALDDVRFLAQIHDRLWQSLERLDRGEWLWQEMGGWQSELEDAETRERWRRVKGSTNLSRRSLAVMRELWRWRRDEALSRDVPLQRVLRDHMLVELARRRSADPEGIRSLRGFERGDLRRHIPDLARRIQTGLDLPDSELPSKPSRREQTQHQVLTQFLSLGLSAACQAAELSPSLVGTSNDLRAFLLKRLGESDAAADGGRLDAGWRAEAVGSVLAELLDGKISLRVADPRAAEPVVFERT